MTQSLGKIQNRVEPYKKEIITGLLITLPVLVFAIVAFMYGDFFQIGTHYPISEYTAVFAYNLVIVVGLLFALSDKRFRFSKGILYYILGIAVVFLILFNQGFFGGDITLSIIDATQLLWGGQNPYVVPAVRHAEPNNPGVFRLGTYAYLPVDLVLYTALLGSFHTIASFILGGAAPDFIPGFNVQGIVLANMIFLVISYIIIRKTLEITGREALLLTLVLFIPVIWNNVCLTQMLFLAGCYFQQRNEPKYAVLFWTLSMLTKYFTGIFIVALLVKSVKEFDLANGLKLFSEMILLTSSFFILFGPIEVLNSTVLFYNTPERVLDGSFGGSAVAEFVLFFGLLDVVWIFTLVGLFCILLVAFLIDDVYKRMIVTSLLSLFVITGIAAQFLPMILYVFILSNRILFFVRELRDQSKSSQLQPESFEQRTNT
ncbi:MAG: hypothetical protein ACFFE8_06895 [Candidatus Heimdallarchaeota archaeon]